MTVVISFSATQWVFIAIQLCIAATGVYYGFLSRRDHREILQQGNEREAKLTEWAKENLAMEERLRQYTPEQMATNIQMHLVKKIDVFQRVLEDMAWLHEQLYATVEHPPDCPVCTSSSRDLEDFIDSVRAVQVMPGTPGEEPE